MKVNDIIGKTTSSVESARAALNAQGEAYAYLEAVRTGTVEDLLKLAAKNLREAKGCSAAAAFEIVGQRGVYIEELARGDSTFHAARKQMQAAGGSEVVIQLT